MRVVLEIISPPNVGRKIVLAAGQTLKVGRTEWADFAVSEDGHMSSLHFSLETSGGNCYLSDLGSSNGTKVAGQRVVEKVALKDGDLIEAGQTLFTVHIESTITDVPVADESGSSETLPNRPGLVAATVPPHLIGGGNGRSAASYTVETCDTGLTLCRGETEGMQPNELALRLEQLLPLFLIVDYNKIPEQQSKETDENALAQPSDSPRDYLFDWLPEASRAVASPALVAAAESPHWASLIAKGWGNDAVVCLFSRQEKTALLHKLRRLCRDRSHAADDAVEGEGAEAVQGGSMFGFCWPSVMSPLLANYKVDFVRHLVEHIDAVLVEFPDLPMTWQLYGDKELPGVLDQLGLVREDERDCENHPD